MSFLIDPPWLYANGRLLGRLPDRAVTPVATATLTAFVATSVSLYLNRDWTRPIWEACRARDGRDWMLNSGVLRIDSDAAGTRTHAVSAAIFASYPLWLWLGYKSSRA